MKNPFAPIFLAALALLGALHANEILPGVLYPFLFFSFFSAVGCYYLKKYKAGYVFIVIALSLLLGTQFLKNKNQYRELTKTNVPPKEYITIHGYLTAYPETRTDHTVLYIKTSHLEYHREKIPRNIHVRVKVNGHLHQLHRGDRVRLDAQLYPLRFNRNFYDNPMADYYLYKDIHFNGYCKSHRLVTVVEKGFRPWRWIGRWRDSIRRAIENKYIRNSGTLDRKGVFLEAILLGERGRLDNITREQLLHAGVFHLLAISGAHIGIIALFSLLLLKRFKLRPRSRYIVTGLLLLVFLVLSGFKISAERAVWMALLIFLAKILYLEIDTLNIISFCGFILLVRNPAAFLDAGFILTFALTAAIVVGRRIFMPLLDKSEKLPQSIKEILSANASAFLAALPLSLYFFKRYSFAGFFAGLLLLPVTAAVTGAGILLIPLAPLSQTLSRYLLFFVDILLEMFFFIVSRMTGGWGSLTIYRAAPPMLLVVFILFIFYLLSIKITPRRKILLGIILLITLVGISTNIYHYKPSQLEVYFLDVGQGDAQVIVFPGGDALLLDGGGSYYSDFQVGRNIILPFILQKRINIKYMAVSHFHPDHCKGIRELLPLLKPAELWVSARAPGDRFYENIIQTAAKEKIKIKNIQQGYVTEIQGCRVQCLHPASFVQSRKPRNNHSMVLKVTGPYHSFLFPGDIEKEVEQELVSKYPGQLASHVLKVPHHGSRTSSSRGFLRAVNPDAAVFSYAQDNRFNFPHPGVIENYRLLKINHLSTARSGGIRFLSLPGKLEIQASK